MFSSTRHRFFIFIALFILAAIATAQSQTPSTDSLIHHSLSIFDLPSFEWSGDPDPLPPRLGVYINEVPADTAAKMAGFPSGVRGFKVWHIMPHWSADESGMLIDDIILKLNGKPIYDSTFQGEEYLNAKIREMRPGDTAHFTVLRDGAVRDMSVRLIAAKRTPMKLVAPDWLPAQVQPGTWLQQTLAKEGLEDWSKTIGKQMRIVADQDFCTMPFTDRPNPWRLNAVTYLHHNPTRVGAYSRGLVQNLWDGVAAGPGLSGAVLAAARDLDIEESRDPVPARPKSIKELNDFMREVQDHLDVAYDAARLDDYHGRAYNPALKHVLPSTVNGLTDLLAMENSWEERIDTTRDPVRKRAVRTEEEQRIASLFAKADRVDMRELMRAAEMIASLADTTWIAEFASGLASVQMKSTANGQAYEWNTWLGRCVIGGRGANHYDSTSDYRLIIDLGGDDTYELPPVPPGTFRIVIDLGGDDLYQNKLSGQGAGIGCVDMLVDVAGNDTYRSTRYSQGAGLLGVGILADFSGDDTYTSHWCSQGAGFLGVGLLYEGGGSDSYNADIYSQAFGYVKGFGTILEVSGNDSYRAGWKYDDSRVPNRAHLSLSQGFGYGMRPWSTGIGADGGIGVLTDKSGDDLYASDFFSQGGSYWYALGILHDASGADRYTAGMYSQGSGIHLSFGALLDDSGDDMYDAYANLEQGNAHDWSAGCLEDYSGNDTYRGYGSSQGSALTVSYAWLLDSQGNDNYYALLSDTTLSQGGGRADRVRKAGSLGMLIDLGHGLDYYVEQRVTPGAVLVKGNKGIIYDDGLPGKEGK